MKKYHQYLWFGLLTCLAGLFALAIAYEWKADKDGYESALVKLKMVCADVTKSDPDGHVYEPVVGRYMGSKSYSANPPSHSQSTWITHKMVLLSEKQEKEVYFGAANREEFKRIMGYVGGIIGDQYMHWPDSPDTNFDIGICARVMTDDGYYGNPESLVKLGVKHD